MTLFRTLMCSEPSFRSIGLKYVDSTVCNLISEPADAILSSTLSRRDSSLASTLGVAAMYKPQVSREFFDNLFEVDGEG